MILLSLESAHLTLKTLFVQSAVFGMDRDGKSQFNWHANDGSEQLLLSQIFHWGEVVAVESLSLYRYKGNLCFKTKQSLVKEKCSENWNRVINNKELFKDQHEALLNQRTKCFKAEMNRRILLLEKEEIRNGETKKTS
jgi:hypothetical protein